MIAPALLPATSCILTEKTWSFSAPVHKLAPEARRLVEFRALNLIDPVWPIGGPFDVIFCRNVLIMTIAKRLILLVTARS